jgi:hypothetical protein
LGVSSKKFFWSTISSLKFSEGRISKKLNNFRTVRDRRKIPTANLYQIEVKESNGDVSHMDHAALINYWRTPEPVGKQCQYLDFIASFDIDLR